MPITPKPSFAFLVVTYNHQNYILEHLESIKYLVLTYGTDIDVDLIVNDDCSKDQTRRLLEIWLQINCGLFRNLTALYNTENLGTCASVNNMLTYVITDRCKLTAGDDVYSHENIFELTKYDLNVAIISGRALFLLGDTIVNNRLSNALATATQVIYENDSLFHRSKHFAYANAPNVLYATECLLHPSVRTYLSRHDVTEDWPLQVAIARHFPKRRYRLIDKVLVYYRRTAGSTYIVANQRFSKDKILIYDDLIQHEANCVERLRLRSRKFSFSINNKFLKKILNLDAYFFGLSLILNIMKIQSTNRKFIVDLDEHKKHYASVAQNAVRFRSQFCNPDQHTGY